MANKTQAKAAVDSAAAAIKADIDATLPTGVDIRDGKINFNPTTWQLQMNAGNLTNADSWLATVKANLTTQARPFIVDLWRRTSDGTTEKTYRIVTTQATYFIVNF